MVGEKIKVKSKNNLILSSIFKSEKYYTMKLGIDFPLTMNYRAEEQQSSRAEVGAIQEMPISSTNAYPILHTHKFYGHGSRNFHLILFSIFF